MNETIALPILAEQFARLAEIDQQSAEKFIRAFFAQVESALAVTDEITINGLGKFYRTNNQAEPLGFMPDKELSAALNEPFAIFEPIEIDDDVDANELATEIVNKEAVEETAEEAEVKPEPEPENKEPETEELLETKSENSESETVQAAENSIVPVAEEEPADVTEEENNEQIDNAQSDEETEFSDNPIYEQPGGNKWVSKLLFFILGVAVGFAIGYFKDVIIPSGTQNESVAADTTTVVVEEIVSPTQLAETDSTEVTDSVETDTIVLDEPDIATVAEPVYDTVTPERFLTTMARKYYGRMEYWVFIYEANSDNLGNPNRIKPGTKVVIPDIKSLTKDETPEQTLERAKRMGREIYERFE